MPVAEIIDFVAAVGERLDLDTNTHLQDALEQSVACSRSAAHPRPGLRRLQQTFDPDSLWFQVDQELGARRSTAGRPSPTCSGRVRRVRAFPPRLVHVLAGNTPGVTAATVARGALIKGVHLLKMPSNDLFTGSAILRTMAEIDPDHPVTRSFSCVYWRGGDPDGRERAVPPAVLRPARRVGRRRRDPQRHQLPGPGFDLVSFDPKVSISMIGREAFASTGDDARVGGGRRHRRHLLQPGGLRGQPVRLRRGRRDGRWRRGAGARPGAVGERPFADAVVTTLPADIRDEVDALRMMAPIYEVFGTDDGTGLVVRSDDPVDFHPSARRSTSSASRRSTTPCVHQRRHPDDRDLPAGRAAELRDRSPPGVQRLVPSAGPGGVRASRTTASSRSNAS